MSPEDFDAHFNRFASSVFRLEVLQHYAGEEDRVEAFRLGLPRPERSVRTSPWLARIAVTTATEGKRWQRVRVVEEPLSDYTRYEMTSYVESQAAGEEIRIVPRGAGSPLIMLQHDFWLFDAGTPDEFALLMDYDTSGRFRDAELIANPGPRFEQERDLALRWSVPLNEYLAGKAAQAA